MDLSSRAGCSNITFTNNKAYTNGTQGFMLDPGSPTSQFLQTPSHDNTFVGNEAYDNGGFGMRLLSASANTITQNNHFYRNEQGLVLDEDSQRNVIEGNVMDHNLSYGVVTQERADNNTIRNNLVSANGNTGIYLHSSGNTVSGNTVSTNTKAGIALTLPLNATPPVVSITNNGLVSNTITGNGDNGIDLRSNVLKTAVAGNVLDANLGHGVYLLNGPTQNTFAHNLMHASGKYGIQGSGANTQNNTWSENQIYGNLAGAISLSGGANASLFAPSALTLATGLLTGHAQGNSTIEIFADNQKQAQYFLGRVTTDGAGTSLLPCPLSYRPST